MPCVLDPLLLVFSPFLALLPATVPPPLPSSPSWCPWECRGSCQAPLCWVSSWGVSGGHFSCPTYGSFFHSGGDPWEPGTSPYVWARGQQGTCAWLGALTDGMWGCPAVCTGLCVWDRHTQPHPQSAALPDPMPPSCPAACPFAGLSSRGAAAPKQPRGARVRATLGTGGQAVLRRLIPNPASSPEVGVPSNPHPGLSTHLRPGTMKHLGTSKH